MLSSSRMVTCSMLLAALGLIGCGKSAGRDATPAKYAKMPEAQKAEEMQKTMEKSMEKAKEGMRFGSNPGGGPGDGTMPSFLPPNAPAGFKPPSGSSAPAGGQQPQGNAPSGQPKSNP